MTDETQPAWPTTLFYNICMLRLMLVLVKQLMWLHQCQKHAYILIMNNLKMLSKIEILINLRHNFLFCIKGAFAAPMRSKVHTVDISAFLHKFMKILFTTSKLTLIYSRWYYTHSDSLLYHHHFWSASVLIQNFLNTVIVPYFCQDFLFMYILYTVAALTVGRNWCSCWERYTESVCLCAVIQYLL